jgi:hypothetical protein
MVLLLGDLFQKVGRDPKGEDLPGFYRKSEVNLCYLMIRKQYKKLEV